MKLYKYLFLLFACFGMLAGGVAHASVACCINNHNKTTCIKMKENKENPCHKNSSEESQMKDSCAGCDCGYCLKINTLPSASISYNSLINPSNFFTVQKYNSGQIGGIFQPPKQIS